MAKSKLSYHDQIEQIIRKITKRINHDLKWGKTPKKEDRAEIAYYQETLKGSACVSWERFKTSWAGENWMIKNGFA